MPPPDSATDSSAQSTARASTAGESTAGESTAGDSVRAHPAVQRVRVALAEAGLTASIVVLDGAARTAAQAAAYLGVAVGQIANSLVFAGRANHAGPHDPPLPVLVLTSGAHRVDPDTVARTLGLAGLERADAEFVRAHTGFAIGGVAPVGHISPMLTAVDRHLERFDVIWAAAGHPHAVFPTTFAELVRATEGRPIEVN
jgi:prolyl-tRNA editing enzyme YbaK/EbsC (Cys-tRNA(Pro) deacylase)